MASVIIITPEYYMDIGERLSQTLDADTVIQTGTIGNLVEKIRLILSCGHTSFIKSRTYEFY